MLSISQRVAIGTAIALTVSSVSARADEPTDEARALFALTKSTKVEYSAYYWNIITIPGRDRLEEASAEFNRGHLHRVESPRDRIIADCEAHTGKHLDISSGKISSGANIANVSCGINTNIAPLAIELVGDVATKFGQAKRLKVTDAYNVREYDVSEDGILLRTSYRENRADGAVLIICEIRELTRSVSDAAMFEEASLSTSYLNERAGS